MPTFAGAKDARQFIHRDVLNSESDLERQQFSSSHSNPALSLQRAQRDPSRLQPYDVLNLQRTIGNQATLQLLRRKSTPQIAPIGDGPRSTLQATPLQSSGSVPPIQRWFGKKKPKVNTETEEQPPQEDLDPDPMTTHGIRPDYRDPQLANQPATRYTLTIAAKRDSKYYLRFQKARLEATIRNEVHKRLNKTTGSKLRVKSTEELKMSAAKKVARRRKGYRFASKVDRSMMVHEIASLGSHVGHSSVKLTAWVGDKPKEVSSFGFYHTASFKKPTDVVDGSVVHPDHMDKDDADKLHRDYTIAQPNYLRALNKAVERMMNPPKYQQIGYNCTEFVREIATTAGVAFPAAAFVIPAAPEKGIHQKTHAYNPSLLYKELLKKKRWGDKKVTRESSTYGYDDTPEPERKPNPYEHSRWYALEPITIYDGNLVLGQVAKGSPLTGTGTCGPLNGDDYANVEDVEVDTHGEFSGETWVKLPDLLAKTEGGSEVYRKLFFPEEFPMEMLTESDPGTTETGGDGGRDLLMEDDGNREGFTMVDEPEPV